MDQTTREAGTVEEGNGKRAEVRHSVRVKNRHTDRPNKTSLPVEGRGVGTEPGEVRGRTYFTRRPTWVGLEISLRWKRMWDLSKTRDIHFYEVYNEDLNDFETEGVILKCRERIWYYYFLEE